MRVMLSHGRQTINLKHRRLRTNERAESDDYLIKKYIKVQVVVVVVLRCKERIGFACEKIEN